MQLDKIKKIIKNQKFIILFGAIILASTFIFTLIVTATSQPRFCAICHEMEPAIKSWEESSHANMTCYSCHGQRDLLSFLIHKANGLKEAQLHLSGDYDTPINVESHLAEDEYEMSSKICNRCHSVGKRDVTESEGIIINHEKHEEKDINCTKCHNRIAHKEANKYIDKNSENKYKDNMKMKSCMKCHTGKKDAGPRECKTCHPSDFNLKPENHSKTGFISGIHGKIAKKDMLYCRQCHFDSKKCISCHKVEMPHPKIGWKKKTEGKEHHSEFGRKLSDKCNICHKGKDFCNDCHHNNKGTQTWIKEHKNRVKNEGAVKKCFKCHSAIDWCYKCHNEKFNQNN